MLTTSLVSVVGPAIFLDVVEDAWRETLDLAVASEFRRAI